MPARKLKILSNCPHSPLVRLKGMPLTHSGLEFSPLGELKGCRKEITSIFASTN